MARGENTPGTSDLARLTLLVGAALLLFGTLLLAIITFAGWAADETAFEQESTLIENTFNQAIERSLSEQKSVAWWDTAVVKITDQSVDYSFLNSEFAQLLTETYRQDEIFVLNTHDEPIYAFAQSQQRTPAPFYERQRNAIEPIISELRRGAPSSLRQRPDLFGADQSHYRVLAGVKQSGRWSGHIVSLGGRPAVVTAITIAPNVDLQLLKGTPMILVSVTYVDAQLIGQIGRSLLLDDLRLSPRKPAHVNIVSKPFVADDGANLGELSWTTKHPGQILLRYILPLVALALAAAGGMFANMFLGLKRALNGLEQSELQARHDALHDPLSGLPNRHHFMFKLGETLARCAAIPEQQVVAAYIDIDRFKDINDTMGHHAGDILIKSVAERLQSQLRGADFLSRFGGDEFAVFSTISGDEEVKTLARQLAQAFVQPIVIEGQGIRVTASIGIAAADHGQSADELIRHADIALYEAKNQGRDRAVLFASGMGDRVAERRAIEIGLRAAIEADELDLYFQPVISARSGRIIGAEALLRWNHSKNGAMSPGAFIPVAEESGLMPVLGDWVLRRALKAAKRWPDLAIAINLSPVQFRHTDLQAQLRRLINEYGVDPRNIVFEITEGVLLESSQRTKKTLEAIRAMGCKLALDDFGTGYSSLAYLCEFKFDKIKIDQSFVAGFARGEVPRSILGAVGALGRGLGMDIVAEGVETEFDALAMRHLGCTEMQGYFFSKAVDAQALDALLAKDSASEPRWAQVN